MLSLPGETNCLVSRGVGMLLCHLTRDGASVVRGMLSGEKLVTKVDSIGPFCGTIFVEGVLSRLLRVSLGLR